MTKITSSFCGFSGYIEEFFSVKFTEMNKTSKKDFRLANRGRMTKKQMELTPKKEFKNEYFESLTPQQQDEMIAHLESVGMTACANFYKKLKKL